MLGQAISVVIAANELRSIGQADILVSVPLDKYNGMDYRKGAEIIKLGYEAAESKASVLSRLSVDEATWQAYLARRNARRRTMPEPQFVEVTGTKPKLATEIESQLSDYVGKPLDTVKFDQDLTYLLGNGRFSSIGYQMIEKGGKQGLQIIAREKEWSPPEVRPLIVIDGSQYDQVQFMLGARPLSTMLPVSVPSGAMIWSSAHSTASSLSSINPSAKHFAGSWRPGAMALTNN